MQVVSKFVIVSESDEYRACFGINQKLLCVKEFPVRLWDSTFATEIVESVEYPVSVYEESNLASGHGGGFLVYFCLVLYQRPFDLIAEELDTFWL